MQKSKHDIFSCPSCKGVLNPFASVGILLSAHNQHKGERGLLSASPEVGNFSVEKSNALTWEKGQRLTMRCPLCAVILNTNKDWEKAIIHKTDSQGKEFEVIFSTIIDEHATYQMEPKTQSIETFGTATIVTDADRQKLWDLVPQ